MSVEENLNEPKDSMSVLVKKKFFYTFFVFLFLFAISRAWAEKKSQIISKIPLVSSIFAVFASFFFVGLVLALGFATWLKKILKAAKKRVFGKTKQYGEIAQNAG